MEIIGSAISMFTDYLVPFVLLLGVLVFVHEFGHFIVAKYFGVRVEVFSIGFGKKIFSYKYGDTTYCLSIIPLGGYVKMFGDDPTKEVSEDEKKYSFLDQPVLPRIAIVAAGPLINFFFAIFIFFIMGLIGGPALPPQLGDITKESTAYETGFRSGDKIQKINGEKIYYWTQMSEVIKDNSNNSLQFDILRGTNNLKLSATPIVADNKNIFDTKTLVGQITGLTPTSRSTLVGISNQKSLAFLSGLKPLDVLSAVGSQKVEFWREIGPALKNAPEDFIIKVQTLSEMQSQGEEVREIQVKGWKPNKALSDMEILQQFGIESSELYISGLQKAKSFLFVKGDQPPAAKAGLRTGDRLYAINDLILKDWSSVLGVIQKYDPKTKELKFEILRNNKKLTFKMQPELNTFPTPQGGRIERYTVGFASAQANVFPDTILKKSDGIFSAATFGVTQALHWTKFTVMTFVRLAENKVSARNIGGVLSIGKIAGMSFAMGAYQFLKMMAIISINLFILNLLPIPVLDGGHLVFFTIEALQGKPLSIRKMEMAQTVGMVLLLSLMVFSIFNDVTNLFSSSGF